MKKVVKITNPKIAAKINKILADKAYIYKKIKEGKVKEIKTEVRISESL